MQELLDDCTLTIERDYPVLSFYSSGYDCGYDQEEINYRIADYLGVKITEIFAFHDTKEVYFVLGE